MTLPEGFERQVEPLGYGDAFGQVGLNRAAQKLGFYAALHHLNPSLVCHDGALSTFADMQILAVTGSADAPDGHRPTISLSLDFLAPAPLGSWVEASVTKLKQTKNLLFTQSRLAQLQKDLWRITATTVCSPQTLTLPATVSIPLGVCERAIL